MRTEDCAASGGRAYRAQQLDQGARPDGSLRQLHHDRSAGREATQNLHQPRRRPRVAKRRVGAREHQRVREGDLTDRHLRHLPVVSNGELLGLLSIGDLVKHRIERIEAEAQAMRAYIGS